MIARFDDFELNSEEGVLSRNGEPIRIEKLPLELLVLFTRRPNEVLRREDIAAALWGDGVHVDEEHGINTAVRKIRQALGDDSGHPRYVETVVRRGYRFRATVEVLSNGISAPAPQPAEHHSPWRAAAILLTLAVGLGALAAYRSRDETPHIQWTPLTRGIHAFSRMASDGKFVYWTETGETACQPFAVPLAGGPAAPVQPSLHDAIVMDAAPPRRLLLKVMPSCQAMDPSGTLWELAADTGAKRRLGNLDGIQDAAWSPDGRRLAFGRGNQLWVANADGGAPARAANLPGIINGIHWSNDSRRLSMGVEMLDSARFALWEVSADGASLRPLLPDWKESSTYQGAVWTRHGLIFESAVHGSWGLWRLWEAPWPSHARHVQQITTGPMEFRAPQPIPGRGDLAVYGTSKHGHLMRYDSGSRAFVPVLDGISAFMTDYSRDGQWMVYVTYPEHELWRRRTDGSQPLRLTTAPFMVGMPRISPDGKWIAFTGGPPAVALRTYVVPIEGGTPRVVASYPDQQVSPTWSADGRHLLIRRDPALTRTPMETSHLEILDISTGQSTPVRDSISKFNQRWSPDGKWIAAEPSNEQELDVYDLKQDRWSVLAAMAADYPAWSADSRYVYFVSHPRGAAGFYRVERATRRVELVADLSRIHRVYEEMWGVWAGVTPDGDPLVLESADLEQIYLLAMN